MSVTLFENQYLRVRRTKEESGPHVTVPFDHYVNCFFISAVLLGEGICSVDGHPYVLKAGDAIAISSEEIHSFRFPEDGPHERISFYFSPSILAPLAEYSPKLLDIFKEHTPGSQNRYSVEEIHAAGGGDVLSRLCASLEQCAGAHTSTDEARLHHLILRLLFVLYDCFCARSQIVLGDEQPSCTLKICHYIGENLSKDLSYRALEKKFYVSRHYLAVTFKKETGMTLTEFVLQKRLAKVSALLAEGCTLATAATEAGFVNYSHFYKIFVARKGISPQKYYFAK